MSQAMGSASGLLSWWDEEFFKMEKVIMDQRFILTVGSMNGLNLRVRIGNIYVHNVDSEGDALWETLRGIFSEENVPWCIGANFNVVRYAEKRIGVESKKKPMVEFAEFIEDCGFTDLPMTRGKYT
ncbi:Uncharacterized protein TCM_025583 [Theobroma cacao]|uniref:Uncharacterized protein n=1 Tax=Theobroma cacao TaxID=3641 RepID=A0A061F6X1_THECC|nr:Uncharacterized protein TCM_025583 [Theobroma cacao]